MNDEYLQSNQSLWNAWTGIHEKSQFYDVEGFKQGNFRLHSLEKEELGAVRGKTLLHLQCHFGLDTLSWANLGATVTGVDFSERAINLAHSISSEMGIPATFIHSNIYDLPEVLHEQYDIIFTSHGVLSWLPDIDSWGQVIAHFLKPGGTFYVVEMHPFIAVFDDEQQSELVPKYPYFQKEALEFHVQGSYADSQHPYKGVEYNWSYTLSGVINALINAGLQIEFLHEFPYMAWQALPSMERGEDKYWRLPSKNSEIIPLMFSLKAKKSETMF